jgi:hypothetical protein
MAGILAFRKGDRRTFQVAFTNRSDGEPYSMTGWAIEASMRFPECQTIDLECDWTDVANGVAEVVIDDIDDALHLQVGDYELHIRASKANDDSISSGPYTIRVRS